MRNHLGKVYQRTFPLLFYKCKKYFHKYSIVIRTHFKYNKSLVIWIILFLFATCLVACQESLEERCARETKEYTRKNCPIAVDEFTTQDSLSYNATTNTIHFYYSISGDTDKLKLPVVRTILLNELRNTTNFKIYKDDGFTLAYTSRSKADA